MNSYELAALAIKDGTKIRHTDWSREEYVYFDFFSKDWLGEDGDEFSEDFSDMNGWEIYVEPKKEPGLDLITWYTPEVYWPSNSIAPNKASKIFRSKGEAIKWYTLNGWKVFGWVELKAPANREDWT